MVSNVQLEGWKDCVLTTTPEGTWAVKYISKINFSITFDKTTKSLSQLIKAGVTAYDTKLQKEKKKQKKPSCTTRSTLELLADEVKTHF